MSTATSPYLKPLRDALKMETVEATCPRCHAKHLYGAELIGRYTICQSCKCRFYVEVPTLAESQAKASLAGSPISPAARDDTTLDDLLWDTQQGSKHIAQLLRRQETKLNLLIGLVIAAAILAAISTAFLAIR